MTFSEAINRAQQRAYSLLKEKIEERRNEGRKVYEEPALCNEAGDIVSAPDGLKLPLRCDLAFQDSTGVIKTEYAESSSLSFREPVFAQWENQLKIEINSICWDYMSFRLLPVSSEYDWEGLRGWFLRWFDTEIKKTPDLNGLSGIVHFISDPEIADDGVKFRVDFGSAPPDALGEFFDELIKLGVETCFLGEPCAPDQFVVKT